MSTDFSKLNIHHIAGKRAMLFLAGFFAVLVCLGPKSANSTEPDYPSIVIEAFKEICMEQDSFEKRLSTAKIMGLTEPGAELEALFDLERRFEPDKMAKLVYIFPEGGAYLFGASEGPAAFTLGGRRSGDCFVRVVQENDERIRLLMRETMEIDPNYETNTEQVNADVWHSVLSAKVIGFRSTTMDGGVKFVTLSRYEASL